MLLNMAWVLSFEARLTWAVLAHAAAHWRDLGIQERFRAGAHSATPRSRRNRRFTDSPIDAG